MQQKKNKSKTFLNPDIITATGTLKIEYESIFFNTFFAFGI